MREEGQAYAQGAALFDVSLPVAWRPVNAPSREGPLRPAGYGRPSMMGRPVQQA